MAITPNIVIAERCLAGNPVIVKLYAGANASKRYRLYGGTVYGTLIYEGLIYTVTDTYSEINISGLFAEKVNTAGVDNYKLVLVSDEDAESDTTYFSVYGGAISKLIKRTLAGTDIFTAKLKKANDNFLLTTRTGDRIIIIPEDELQAFSYYAKGIDCYVKADGETIAGYEHSGDTDESIQVIDMAALRAQLVTDSNKLVNVFDMVTDSSYSFSVVIVDAGQRTDFFLKFKNSWGVYEKIGLRGQVDYAPVWAEAVKINQYDETVNDFISNQERKELTNVLTATTGYKTDDERLFLLDMLMSDSVVLIACGREYAVNVTTDTNLFASTKSEPATVNLKLELKDMDGAFTPMVITPAYEILTTPTLEEIEANGAIIIV